MAYRRKDHFFKQAKKQNYAARSVFKLEDIDQKLKLIQPRARVLDLGAAPGSWSQYCSEKVGAHGEVIGVDLQEIQLTLPNARFIQKDLNDVSLTELGGKPFDVVLSDMAPKTTGVRITDQARSLALCELALEVATETLKKGGSFCCKIFHSADFQSFRNQLKSHFEKVEVIRPKAVRKESKEIYLVGTNYFF